MANMANNITFRTKNPGIIQKEEVIISIIFLKLMFFLAEITKIIRQLADK